MNVEMFLPLAFELLERGCDCVFDMFGTQVGTPNKQTIQKTSKTRMVA